MTEGVPGLTPACDTRIRAGERGATRGRLTQQRARVSHGVDEECSAFRPARQRHGSIVDEQFRVTGLVRKCEAVTGGRLRILNATCRQIAYQYLASSRGLHALEHVRLRHRFESGCRQRLPTGDTYVVSRPRPEFNRHQHRIVCVNTKAVSQPISACAKPHGDFGSETWITTMPFANASARAFKTRIRTSRAPLPGIISGSGDEDFH